MSFGFDEELRTASKRSNNGFDLLDQANLELNQRHIAQALGLFDAAEAQGEDPDLCSAGRWTCYMLMGDYGRAWLESDAITNRGKPDPHRFWNGSDLSSKKVLLRCLHGL